MKKVICNASPIIGLSIIGKLNLLWKLFDVTIPKEVYNEVVEKSFLSEFGKEDLKKAVSDNYIKIYEVKDVNFINKSFGILHKGELEVVLGAIENSIDTVIIDEKTARNFATTLNIKTLGIIGILRLAKQKSLIDKIKPHLQKLIDNKYRISESLLNQVLKEEGEL